MITTTKAAAILGLSPVTVRALANKHNIGEKLGRDWVFRPADLAKLTARNTKQGRPRKNKSD